MPQPATEPTTAHEHARVYAGLGLRVLPIRVGGKAPPMASWQHAATNDVSTIDNWWNGLYGRCGVGIALGDQPNGMHLFALDVDDHGHGNGADELQDLERVHGPLPDTWRAITGSGNTHIVFRAPAGVTVRNQQANGNRVAPNIDVRGAGGQIVVAPTVHPDSLNAYHWEHGFEPWTIEPAVAPDWLVDLVREPDAPVSSSPSTSSSAPRRDDLFAAHRSDWDWTAELLRRGWTQVRSHGTDTYWARPGKDARAGHSAVLHGTDGPFVVFTTEIDQAWTAAGTRTSDGSGWSFGAFGFYAATEHAGDRSAAARALSQRYGVDLDVDLGSLVAAAGGVETVEQTEDDWARWDVVSVARQIETGERQRVEPELLRVEDALPLLYPGRTHSLFGTPGGGKTWIALTAVAEHLRDGGHVLFIDWEDSVDGTIGRLLQLGVDIDDLARFDYRSPSTSLLYGWSTLEADDTPWSLVVIDSTGEAMSAGGINPNDDGEVAAWMMLAKRLTRRVEQPAVLMLDHIPKATDAPSGFAIGSQRKLAAITGAAYRCDTLIEPARGKPGKLKLVVAKDRLGNRAKGSTAAVVDLVDGDGGGLEILLHLSDAQLAAERGERFRPTTLMERVSRWLEINPGASSRVVCQQVTGKTDAIRLALEVLVEEGWISVERVGKGNQYRSIRPYTEAQDLIQAVDNWENLEARPTAPHRAPTAPRARPETAETDRAPRAPRVRSSGARGAVDGVLGEDETSDRAPQGSEPVDNQRPNPLSVLDGDLEETE